MRSCHACVTVKIVWLFVQSTPGYRISLGKKAAALPVRLGRASRELHSFVQAERTIMPEFDFQGIQPETRPEFRPAALYRGDIGP